MEENIKRKDWDEIRPKNNLQWKWQWFKEFYLSTREQNNVHTVYVKQYCVNTYMSMYSTCVPAPVEPLAPSSGLINSLFTPPFYTQFACRREVNKASFIRVLSWYSAVTTSCWQRSETSLAFIKVNNSAVLSTPHCGSTHRGLSRYRWAAVQLTHSIFLAKTN